MQGKLILKKIIPYSLRLKLKKNKRRVYNKLSKRSPKINIRDVENLLVYDFGIVQGDSLIVSSSFGNLNTDFSPNSLIKLLQNIVGVQGNIVMPFYPPGNSYEWAESCQVFDMQTTRSSMGILTQVFSEMPDVYKSMHPTKAIVAWGRNAVEIVRGHENSKTPFYWDSPYGWLLKNPSKSLGLGLKNIPIFHSFEDIIFENKISLYQNKRHSLKVQDYNNNILTISTLVHSPQEIAKLIDAGDYVISLGAQSYIRKKFGFSFCYVIDNMDLFNKCKFEFLNGNFREKK